MATGGSPGAANHRRGLQARRASLESVRESGDQRGELLVFAVTTGGKEPEATKGVFLLGAFAPLALTANGRAW